MGLSKRTAFRILQVAVAVVVVAAAVRSLHGEWGRVREVARDLRPSWTLVLASGAVVLATYALLVDAWRRVVNGMGGRLAMGDAARIWFVANLARYAGSLWQIGALGLLSQRAGVSPVTATGAALVIAIVNVLSGFAVILATGVGAVALDRGRVAALALGIVALLFAPLVTEPVARLASRLTGRSIVLPKVTPAALWVAAAGTAAAWVAYGVAFRLLAIALFGTAPGGWMPYVWVYTASYLAGWLALAPAGFPVAESAMVTAFAAAGVLTPAQALALAAVSRLWRTALEVLPGLAFLALRRARGERPAATSDGTRA